jgi:hypothetical protein
LFKPRRFILQPFQAAAGHFGVQRQPYSQSWLCSGTARDAVVFGGIWVGAKPSSRANWKIHCR